MIYYSSTMIVRISLFCLISFLMTLNASAQFKVDVSMSKSSSDNSVQSFDSLKISVDSETKYFGRQFGKGVLLAYQINTNLPDSVSIHQLIIPFYGGRTDETGELTPARIKAGIWNNVIDSTSILPTNSTRSSAAMDLIVSAEQIRWATFSFTDTSIISLNNAYIGIYYEKSIDSVSALSPVFSEAPPLLKPVYYRDYGKDSTLSLDTVRYSHQTFWKNPELIGSMDAFALIKNKKMGQVATSIEPILLPNQLKLNAFPNPFNPSTAIKIEGLGQGEVEIEIFNSLGQRVHLYKSNQNFNSTFNYNWNANGMASGVYFVKVKQNKMLGLSIITLLK